MVNSESNNSLVLSFLHLRKLIGILGIALPVTAILYALAFSPCHAFESSISAYYHTHIRNIFVGILCAVGVFLATYKGYDMRDTVASRLAGCFAFCVAMFPTNERAMCENNGLINTTVGTIHYSAAAGLFLILAYMSIWLFTKTSGAITSQKLRRNAVYRSCGWVMVGSIALMLLFHLTGWIASLKPVFWLETISLFAFGLSWLTKGEAITLLNDKEPIVK